MESKDLWKNERLLLALLLIFYLVTRLSLVTYLPFVQDENVYSMMIEDQIENPTLNPTFLGYEVGWKPPLFFWVYGVFAMVLTHLPIPLEAVYRLPTVLFGLLNVFLVFRIMKNMFSRIEVAFFTALIFEFTFLVIYTDNLVITDTLAMTFILASILAYMHARENQKFFLLAGFFSFLAFFTKQVNALVAPIFIAAYFFQFERKKLLHPLFILSLLFIPAAFLLNYVMFSSSEQAYAVYSDLIEHKIIQRFNLQHFYGSIGPFYLLVSIWLPLSLFGLVKHWKENLAMSLWYVLLIFPFIAGYYTPFYYLPVIPAIAYFSALMLLHNEKKHVVTDTFFYFVLALMIVVGLAIGMYLYNDIQSQYMPQKEAGELLVSKQNVAVIGDYAPGVISYKVLSEKRKTGSHLDYGWVLTLNSGQDPQPFVSDYYFESEEVVEGFFGRIFFDHQHIYRKDSNITEFDYFVLIRENLSVNGTLLYNESNIRVYRR